MWQIEVKYQAVGCNDVISAALRITCLSRKTQRCFFDREGHPKTYPRTNLDAPSKCQPHWLTCPKGVHYFRYNFGVGFVQIFPYMKTTEIQYFISEVVTPYTNQVHTVTKLVNLSVKTLSSNGFYTPGHVHVHVSLAKYRMQANCFLILIFFSFLTCWPDQNQGIIE